MRYAGRRVDNRRPGIDVTVSAPKSVSVLFGLGDPDTALQVRAAHQAAVVEVVGFLESVAGHGLRGHQGDGQRAKRIGTDGWIVAGFEHRTSRADDPQLHTHLVVPNLLHGADGKWSAMDAKEIYRHALTGPYLFDAVLRGQLTQRLGLAWTAPVKGVAEIDGIPADLLGEFSTRRRQILTAMDAAGKPGPDAAQAACLATRPGKTRGVREETLGTGGQPGRGRPATTGGGWWARCWATAGHPLATPRPARRYLLGPAGLTAQATGFDRRDLLQAICQALPTGTVVDRAQLEVLADRVLASRDVIRLVAPPEDGPRWTTTDCSGWSRPRWASPAASPQSRPATSRQTSWQRPCPDGPCPASSGRWSSGLPRPMGCGGGRAGRRRKTAALDAAAWVWAGQGRPVTGAAVAAVTARRLEHATGIEYDSLTRLLNHFAGPTRPPAARSACPEVGCWWSTRPPWSTPAP